MQPNILTQTYLVRIIVIISLLLLHTSIVFCLFVWMYILRPTCWIPAAVRIHIRSQLITGEELQMHWIQNWPRAKRSSRRCAQVCYILVPLPSSPPASACVAGLRADSLLKSPAWRKVWKDILLTGDGFSSLLTPLLLLLGALAVPVVSRRVWESETHSGPQKSLWVPSFKIKGHLNIPIRYGHEKTWA